MQLEVLLLDMNPYCLEYMGIAFPISDVQEIWTKDPMNTKSNNKEKNPSTPRHEADA